LPNKLAKDERDNVRIGLDRSGDAYSWIHICPRHKIYRDGDRVLSNAEVYLKVAERGSEYIHLALKEPSAGNLREINCSLETTSWKLGIYQSCLDTIDKGVLLSSQLIYIHDPETKSYLSIQQLRLESLAEEETLMDDNELDPDHQFESQDDTQPVFPNIVLAPVVEDHIDTNFLWIIESNSLLSGGPFKWKADQVRFKHFNSSRYLMLEALMDYDEDDSMITHYAFTVTHQREHPGTLFNVTEINSATKYLGNGKAVQIGHAGMWIERGEVIQGAMFTFMVVGTRDKEDALSLVVQRYTKPMTTGDMERVDDYIDPSMRLDQSLDVHVGLSIRNYLQKYYEMTVVLSSTELNTLWPTASRTDIKSFKLVFEKIIAFTMGHPLGTMMEEAAAAELVDIKVMNSRQNLLREQGGIELLLRFIHKLLPIIVSAKSRKIKLNTDKSFLFRMCHMVLHECFSLMLNVLKENPANQMYVADFMPLFLANLGNEPLAVYCVTEMLSKNLELQETKIGAREIQIFVDKLKDSELNTMYLQLLQACCSCRGKGVDGNQCKVADMLFENTDGIIMTMRADYSYCSKVDWNVKNGLYIPQSAEFTMRGESLVYRGLPLVTLEWLASEENNTNHIAALEELFDSGTFQHGQDDSNLNLSYRSFISTQPSAKMRHFAVQQRKEIGGYFIAEMFLGAEMCMDRNYVAMQKLDDLFPYDVLLSILKMNVANSLKAAAVRLLTCLHVDRYPQASSKIPSLTRTWSDIKKQTEPKLPFVEPSRQYTFGMIQHLVSEHVHNMARVQWDELSKHILKMLRTLVVFNFMELMNA
jgi:hypothetical protein